MRVFRLMRSAICAAVLVSASPVACAISVQAQHMQLGRVVVSSSESNEDDLRHPAVIVDMGVRGDTVFVVDRRMPGVVLMNLHTLRIIGTIAPGAGSGPGELRRPMRVILANGNVLITDVVNSRVTHYRPDGSVEHTTPLLHPAAASSLAVTPDGRIATTGGAPATHLLLRGDSAGQTPRRPFGSVPRRAAPDPAAGSNLVVGSDSRGRILVVDNEGGSLVAVGPDGSVRTLWTLPAPYRDSIQRERETLRRRNPNVVVPVTFVRNAYQTEEHVLLLGQSTGSPRAAMLAWIVDLRTLQAVSLTAASSVKVDGRIVTVAMSSGRILVATDEDIIAMEVRR